jgi:hypothetical protein
MRTRSLRLIPALLAAIVAGVMPAQQDERSPFRNRDGYEEARFGGANLTIKTSSGVRTIHVGFAKLRVGQTGSMAKVRLPGAGLALLQHAGGTVKVTVGQQTFDPLEGEWMRLPLPAEVTLGTASDTAQLELILVEER